MALLSLQFVGLDADPSPLKELSDVADEGYWIHNARCLALFGEAMPDDLNQGYHGAPAFFAAEYAAFRAFGVSFFTARMVSLLFFQLVLIELFVVFWMRFGSGWYGLVPAVALGVCHEALVFARWATPIPTVMLGVASVIFFFEVGRSRVRLHWFVFAGLAGPLTVLGKLSAVFFLFAVVAFFIFEVVVRRLLSKNQVWAFAIGFAVGLAVLAVFFCVNLEGIESLDRNLGGRALRDLPDKGNVSSWVQDRFVIRTAAYLKHGEYRSLLRSAGTALLSLAAFSLCLAFFVRGLRLGWRRCLSSLESYEVYSVVALVVLPACLIATGSNVGSRRIALLLVPLALLAASFFVRAWKSPKTCFVASGMPDRFVAVVALLVNALLAWMLLRNGAAVLTARWLDPAGWNGPATALVTLGITILMWLVLCGASLCSCRCFAVSVAAVFLVVNLSLDFSWVASSTYTVRDASRRLDGLMEHREMISGEYAHWLAVETKALPIWYWILTDYEDSPWALSAWNGGFLSGLCGSGASIVTTELIDDGARTGKMRYISPQRLPTRQREDLLTLSLDPNPKTDKYRLRATVVRLRAASVESSGEVNR